MPLPFLKSTVDDYVNKLEEAKNGTIAVWAEVSLALVEEGPGFLYLCLKV